MSSSGSDVVDEGLKHYPHNETLAFRWVEAKLYLEGRGLTPRVRIGSDTTQFNPMAPRTLAEAESRRNA